MRAALLLGMATALWAQTQPDPTDVLLRARDKMVDRAKRADNYTCVLTINHKYFKSDRLGRPSCDQLIGDERRERDRRAVIATDRVRLDIKVSGGIEIGSWPGASRFDSRNIVDLARGTFESGTLGPVLQDIFLNEAADFQYIDHKLDGAATLLEYAFQVPAEASHLSMRSEGNWSEGLAYQGSLRIDSASFDLKRLMVRTDDLPEETNTCLATITAEYQRTRIGLRDFLMPRDSVFRTVMSDGSVSEGVLEYSNCREYQAESTLDFGAPPAAEPAPKKVPAASSSLPAGLTFSVVLTSPIDTGTAAAGDVIAATVRNAVVDRSSKAVLIPAGTAVRGRIVRLEHFPGSHFVIAFQLESLESDGSETLLSAKPGTGTMETEQTGLRLPGVRIILPPLGESSSTASLIFRTSKDRYVVPAGYQLNWVTTLPPSKP
jgi:hypothetical protein